MIEQRSLSFKLDQKRTSGYTLVELAIVLAIVGVLLASGLYGLRSVTDQVNRSTTQQRLDGISDAFARYARRNYFLPCPAPPPVSGTPVTGIARTTCTSAVDSTGLVPYATIGLRATDVKDSYGNYITYAVNSALATEATVQGSIVPSAAAGARPPAMKACRSDYIWVQRAWNLRGMAHNERKARFCCYVGGSPTNDDLRVMSDVTSDAVQISPLRGTRDDNDASVRVTYAGQTPSTPPWSRTETAAFVLVSHGRNGLGSYIPDGRLAGAVGLSPQETENIDDDNVFVSAPFSGAQANFFDDIVAWRTQSQLLSAFGWNSCGRP